MTEEREPIETSFFATLDDRLLLIILLGMIVLGFFLIDIGGMNEVTRIFRLVLLVSAVFLVYLLWPRERLEEAMEPEGEDPFDFQNIVENVESFSFVPGEEKVDFYQELDRFFDNLVKMIRATFVAHSAVIFLWDTHSEKLRVEFFATQSKGLRRGDLVETKGTLPGSVFVNQTAVLEQNIPDEAQPVNYYHDTRKIKSFLAVPLTINNEVRGVLSVDSLVAHDFSEEDLELLKAYENLISHGIRLIGEREKSQLVNQSLRAQQIFLTELNEELSYDNLYSAVGSACRVVYRFDRLTIATIDSENSEMGIVTKVIGQRDAMGEGFRFPLNDGITGWVIRKNKPLLLGDLEKGDLFRPRYAASDKSNFGLRSFLGAPISFRNQVFGMISIESKQPDYYSEWDQHLLILLAANVGLAALSLRLLPPKG